MLLAQPRFDCLALGDVGIGGDEADDMVANMQRLALDQVRGPVRSGALEAMRLELAGQAGDALDMRFDVARAIFAVGGGDADQLAETTMDRSKRTLRRVTLSDAAGASDVFELLMGNEVAPRRDFIVENADDLDRERIDA